MWVHHFVCSQEDAAADAARERLIKEQEERMRALRDHIEQDKQEDAERERRLKELEVCARSMPCRVVNRDDVPSNRTFSDLIAGLF